MTFTTSGDGSPHYLARLRFTTRTSTLPQTPTMTGTGAPEVNLSAWVVAASGMEAAPGTSQQLKEAITKEATTQEIKIHAELVKAAGLVPQ